MYDENSTLSRKEWKRHYPTLNYGGGGVQRTAEIVKWLPDPTDITHILDLTLGGGVILTGILAELRFADPAYAHQTWSHQPKRTVVAVDTYDRVINFWKVVQTRPRELADLLSTLPWHQGLFEFSIDGSWMSHDSFISDEKFELWDAAFFYIACHMTVSAGGLVLRPNDFRWKKTVDWGDHHKALREVRARLDAVWPLVQNVDFIHKNALEVIHGYKDKESKLIVFDPPFSPETRDVVYSNEMTQETHEAIVSELAGCNGYVIICGYDNPLYARRLVDNHRWYRSDFEVETRGKKRIESLWISPRLYSYQKWRHARVKDEEWVQLPL